MTHDEKLALSLMPAENVNHPKPITVQQIDEHTGEAEKMPFQLPPGKHLIHQSFLDAETLGTFVEDPTKQNRLLLLVKQEGKS